MGQVEQARIQKLRERYRASQLLAVARYFEKLVETRKTRRLAESVIIKEMEYWERFPADVVVQALEIHIRKYPHKREDYARGIMRSLAREQSDGIKKPGGTGPKRGRYGQGKYKGHYIDGASEDMPF